MDSTSLDIRAFTFIITLAAVINGLGIIRWLTEFSEYLLQKRNSERHDYWVFNLLAAFQFFLHVMMWWIMWSFRDAANFNFLTYLYLLTGPVLLFLGTSALSSNIQSNEVDVRNYFSDVRPVYSTVLALLWIWAILAQPIVRGALSPTTPLLAVFFVAAVVLRATTNPKVHGIVAVFSWLLAVAYIALYAFQLGGNAIPVG